VCNCHCAVIFTHVCCVSFNEVSVSVYQRQVFRRKYRPMMIVCTKLSGECRLQCRPIFLNPAFKICYSEKFCAGVARGRNRATSEAPMPKVLLYVMEVLNACLLLGTLAPLYQLENDRQQSYCYYPLPPPCPGR